MSLQDIMHVVACASHFAPGFVILLARIAAVSSRRGDSGGLYGFSGWASGHI